MEEWRKVVGWPNYEVSRAGQVRRAPDAERVRGARRGGELTLVRDRKGYLRCAMRDRTRRFYGMVHRLVAAAFIGPQPSADHEVAHNDGSRDNNRVENLRWATSAENSADMVLHGRSQRGSLSVNHKLTEDGVRDIRVRRRAGAMLRVLAEEYGVSQSAIWSVTKGRAWVWLDQVAETERAQLPPRCLFVVGGSS